MGGKNRYLEEKHLAFLRGMEVGIRLGTQFERDCMQIALRSKDAVGKDIFGRGRLNKVFSQLAKIRKKYIPALHNEKISDCLREALDAELREIYGTDTAPFEVRYPEIKEIDITKAKKSWLD